MTFRRNELIAVFSLIPCLLVGCGGTDRPALAPASGTVKLDGVAVEGASVTFFPAGGGRPASGVTDAKGRYSINTYQDAPGAIVGEHQVSVTKVSGPGAYASQKDAPATSSESDADNSAGLLSEITVTESGESNEPQIVYEVPQKYMNPKDSGLQITVPPGGSDSLDLDLSSE
jgi:hypothetical protein